jgi:hypothetical protein
MCPGEPGLKMKEVEALRSQAKRLSNMLFHSISKMQGWGLRPLIPEGSNTNSPA